jgi:hypothetical protein
MRNNLQKTKEEIINEVKELNTLREQLILKKERVIKDYCISISPYKIGDKFIDEHGKVFMIKRISPWDSVFNKKYRSSSYYPFFYYGWELKKDGTPKKNGGLCLWNFKNHPELNDKKIKEEANKNLQIIEEGIVNEVMQLNKRIKQLYLKKDRMIIKYCISKSPYKIGDKFIDKYGNKIIIDEINPSWHLFEEQYYYGIPDILNHPFNYWGRVLKQDGTPKKISYSTAFYDGEQPEKETNNDGSN